MRSLSSSWPRANSTRSWCKRYVGTDFRHSSQGIHPGPARAAHARAAVRAAEVQILIDGTNSNTASLVSSYAASIVAEYSVDVMERQQRIKLLARSPGGPVGMAAPQVTARSRVWFNPDLYS